MAIVDPNAITGWSPLSLSSRLDESLYYYQVDCNHDSTEFVYTTRAELPLSKTTKRWIWEIEITGTTPAGHITFTGVSTEANSPIQPTVDLLQFAPGTLYLSDGSINGTSKTFDPYGDGDLLTFMIDYDEKFLIVFKNGLYQGTMFEGAQFPSNTEFYPYFGTNKDGIGCYINDGARRQISKDTLTWNLRYPINPSFPSDDDLSPPVDVRFKTALDLGIDIYDMQDEAAALGITSVSDAHAYYFSNEKLNQSLPIAALSDYGIDEDASISFDPPYTVNIREDLSTLYWNFNDAALGISLENNNLAAASALHGGVRTNLYRSGRKLYCEYLITVGAGDVSVGVANSSAPIDQYAGYDRNSWGFASEKLLYDGEVIPVPGAVINNGDIINMALDLDTKQVWFGINDVYILGGDPAADINPSFSEIAPVLYPMISSMFDDNWLIGANFITTSFVHTPPIGFEPIDGTSGPTNLGRPTVVWDDAVSSSPAITVENASLAQNNTAISLTENSINAYFGGSDTPFTFSTKSHISGKRYVEFDIIFDDPTETHTFIGLSTLPDSAEDFANNLPEKYVAYFGSDPLPGDHYVTNNFGAESHDAQGYVSGDTVMMAIDFDLGAVWFGKNGTWSGGHPAINSNPNWQGSINEDYFYVIAGDINAAATGHIKVNFGQDDFTYSVPNNYTSWNIPSDQGWDPSRLPAGLALSSNKLTVNGLGSTGLFSGLASIGHETGKHYFEVRVADLGPLPVDSANVGLGQFNTPTNSYLGATDASWSTWQLTGGTSHDNVDDAVGAVSWSNLNDVVMVAADLDTGEVWFGINGTWINGGDPETNTTPRYNNLSGMVFPAFGNDSLGIGDIGQLEINLLGPFAYSAPVGYDAWDIGFASFGGIDISQDGLSASGIGHAIANVAVGFSDTQQWYIEFHIDDDTDITGVGVETIDLNDNIERILYQSDGSLGLLDRGINTAFDPVKSSPTWQFFNDDVQAADIGLFGMSQTTTTISSGKHYWEVTIESPSDAVATVVGFVPTGTPVTEFPGQENDGGIGWYAVNGNIYFDGDPVVIEVPYGVGDVLSFALDVDAGSVWFAKNGVWIDGDPGLGTDPTFINLNIYSTEWIAAVGDATNTYTETVAYTSNFGQFDFSYNKPSGFEAYGAEAGPGTYPSFTVNDVIGLSIDADTNEIWWSLNNTFIAGDAVAGTGNPVIMDGSVRIVFETLDGGITGNFGTDFFIRPTFRNFEPFGCGEGGFPSIPSFGWDPVGDGVLSNQDLTYTQDGLGVRTIDTPLVGTEKIYMEFTIEEYDGNVAFGILDNTLYYNGSICFINSTLCGPSVLPLIQQGDTVMMAFNQTANQGWMGINGSWFNNGDPSIGSNPLIYTIFADQIFFSVEDGIGGQGVEVRANLGSTDFKYVLPNGYQAYDQSVIPGINSPCSTPLSSQVIDGYLLTDPTNREHVIGKLNTNYLPQFTSGFGNVDYTLTDSFNIIEEFPFFGIELAPDDDYDRGADILISKSTNAVDNGDIPPLANFAIQYPYDLSVSGFDINFINDESMPQDMPIVISFSSAFPPPHVAINLDDLYDFGSLLQGNFFSLSTVLEVRYDETASWPPPTTFSTQPVTDYVLSTTPLFTSYDVEFISAVHDTPSSMTVPISRDITIQPVFDSSVPIIYSLDPTYIEENILTGAVLQLTPDVTRIVYLQPEYPEKESGRIGGP